MRCSASDVHIRKGRFNIKTFALILFIMTYALMLLLPRYRAYIALTVAGIFLAVGVLPAQNALGAVDWNVLMMLAGIMGTVDLFIKSNMPARLADGLVRTLPSAKWVFIALTLFAGLVSAFIDNVATVLMVAPIGLAIAKRQHVSPVPVVLAIAVSSNLQGAATLVGDTTSILLGNHLGMDFADFFFMNGHPGMFWIVQAGALATIPVLMLLFRRNNEPLQRADLTPVNDYGPTVLLLGTVFSLIAASFIPEKPAVTNGVICLAFYAMSLIHACLRNKSLRPVFSSIREIDYATLLLLGGLFLVIEGITQAGIIDDISSLFVRLGGSNMFVIYTIIVWSSVLFSAFIDNIPYVATMLPVVGGIAASIGKDPTVLYFGLLAGATLGGNLTPVGASANIAAGGILRREGHEVSTLEFMKVGVPFTLTAVVTGYLLIWFIYM